MERNFRNVNVSPHWPMRSWRNSTGPSEVNFTAAATARMMGEKMMRASRLPTMSMKRFIFRETPFFFSPSSRSL